MLIVHYSQTGQLSSLARKFCRAVATAGVQVDCVNIVPEQAFPFPWPFWRFFDTFPETVHLKPAPILPPQIPSENYDVVVIAYTVWFLSPSQPMTAFLQREETRRLLDGKPVITLIGCPQYVAGRAGKNEIFAETKRRQTHRQHRKNRCLQQRGKFHYHAPHGC